MSKQKPIIVPGAKPTTLTRPMSAEEIQRVVEVTRDGAVNAALVTQEGLILPIKLRLEPDGAMKLYWNANRAG